jgi:hypothetical protein
MGEVPPINTHCKLLCLLFFFLSDMRVAQSHEKKAEVESGFQIVIWCYSPPFRWDVTFLTVPLTMLIAICIASPPMIKTARPMKTGINCEGLKAVVKLVMSDVCI